MELAIHCVEKQTTMKTKMFQKKPKKPHINLFFSKINLMFH